jgi:hypothetical protein
MNSNTSGFTRRSVIVGGLACAVAGLWTPSRTEASTMTREVEQPIRFDRRDRTDDRRRTLVGVL